MLKFDDQFPIHRKVHGLTDAAFRLHVEAIFWCRRNLTDGFIVQDDLVSVSRYRRPEGYVAELVRRGAWHRVDSGELAVECRQCRDRYGGMPVGDGWLIHGYLDWQDSREKAIRVREVRKAAGRAGGIRSGESRSKRQANPKQVATGPVEPRAPRPPTGGSVGARARRDTTLPKPHPFADDGNGNCTQCPLPRVNKIHPPA